ncbi:MAG: sugar transferase [Chloroflexi bacterium]|nr:MAG: sugar transferase [Chloroflexota bacterium]
MRLFLIPESCARGRLLGQRPAPAWSSTPLRAHNCLFPAATGAHSLFPRRGGEKVQVAIDTGFEDPLEQLVAVGSARGWFDYEHGLKRALDVVLSLLFLAGALPLLLVIVLAVRLDSPGPVLFVQERVGLRGRRFRFYKFRSMYADAERRLAEVQHLNEATGPVFKVKNDPRITRVGRLLRRTSLDELPQLINVLRGEMSLVGPRPPLPSEVAAYRVSDMQRLTVKPGLTCWWQIRGRSQCDFDTWMSYDREYIAGLSLLTDVRILMGTVLAVLTARGAY